MATIDKYTLSSTLNDEDLFLVAKYDSSTAQYVDYNKYKVSSLKALIQSISETTNPGGGNTGGTTPTPTPTPDPNPDAGSGSNVSLDYNDYTKVLGAADEDAIMIAKYNADTQSYGDLRIISVADLKGTGKIEEDYLILQDQKGTEYRMYLAAEGNTLKVEKESSFAERQLLETQNVSYHGLLINMIYGAGTNLTKMPVSHNFIELYNLTNTELNLNGLHIHYKDTTTYTEWQTLELKGSVPAYSSFLIVGGRCANPWDTQCRHQIKN